MPKNRAIPPKANPTIIGVIFRIALFHMKTINQIAPARLPIHIGTIFPRRDSKKSN